MNNGLSEPNPSLGLNADATIEQLTTAASLDPTFKIFSSQSALNDYAAGLNDELTGLIPAGIYANENNLDKIDWKTLSLNYNAIKKS